MTLNTTTILLCASKNCVENGSPTRCLPAKEWKSQSDRQPQAANRRRRPNSNPSALENFGVAAVPDDRLISNDDSRARLQGVVDLLSKLRVDAEARRNLFGRNAAASVRHTHPSSRGPARSKRALPIGCTLKQRVDMVPKRSAPVNLEGSAPDGIAVTNRAKRCLSEG